MAGRDAHRSPAAGLAGENDPALNLEQRAGTAVLDHPLRPGVDRASVATARAVAALGIAPQPPLLLGCGLCPLALRASERLDELELRHRLGASGLRHLE